MDESFSSEFEIDGGSPDVGGRKSWVSHTSVSASNQRGDTR